jgi:HAD superfamily hydrolase (TIGR01484 family)
LLPTCGTKFFQYTGEWTELYSEDLTSEQKKKIIDSLDKAAGETGYRSNKVWGDVIEDRGSQVTYSALGQQAPLAEKQEWDPDFGKRKKITAILETLIPEFSVRIGGTTSIDVTKPGIDKAYGIGKLRDTLHISFREMIYVGDALFPGGNDYPAEEAGVVSIPVKGPNDTNLVIKTILACLGGSNPSDDRAPIRPAHPLPPTGTYQMAPSDRSISPRCNESEKRRIGLRWRARAQRRKQIPENCQTDRSSC